MQSFSIDVRLDSSNSTENDRSVTSINYNPNQEHLKQTKRITYTTELRSTSVPPVTLIHKILINKCSASVIALKIKLDWTVITTQTTSKE